MWSAMIRIARVTFGVGAVRVPGELLGEPDQGREGVGVEDRVDALLDHRHPLEPEPRVDVALRQFGQRAVLVQLVGHEDVVPVLEEAVRVVAGAQVVGAELRAAVDVHLRARAAGARRALPARSSRSAGRSTIRSSGTPISRQIWIASVSGPSPSSSSPSNTVTQISSGSKPKPVERELPAVAHRLGLEVVADGEVAEHLEEGQVALGRPDNLDVDRSESALRGGQPPARRLLATLEVGFELLHPGDREQGRGVVRRRHQRRRTAPAGARAPRRRTRTSRGSRRTSLR